MKIGIDCISIDSNYVGGINTYTIGLLDGFVNVGSKYHFYVFVTPQNAFLFNKYKQYKNFSIVLVNDNLNLLKKILRRLSLFTYSLKVYKFVNDLLFNNITRLIESKVDIIYTPTTILSTFNNKKITVLSMHDILQFHYPEFFTKFELLVRKITFQLSTYNAKYIQASSEFIKHDLLHHFKGLKPEQVVVIPEGVNIPAFRLTKETDYLIEKYEMPENFIFFPAQLWKHKNHITVLKALLRLKHEKNIIIPLVMTGAKHLAANEIFDFIKNNQMNYVFYLGKVPFEDMVSLYKKAKILITAVLYESSSLPILESAASGIPIIASKIPSNMEMNNVLQLNLFEPLNDIELSDLIIKLWNDNAFTTEQIMNNNLKINYYSWNNVAEKYLNFFESILRNINVVK